MQFHWLIPIWYFPLVFELVSLFVDFPDWPWDVNGGVLPGYLVIVKLIVLIPNDIVFTQVNLTINS